MQISKVDNTTFKAGNVHLERINNSNVPTIFKTMKKIAEDKNIDIFISKNKESEYLPYEDFYIVRASKDIPVITRGFFPIGKTKKNSISYTILSKKADDGEVSVKIYNATMQAIESLEKKLSKMN